jgi:hypothetical protein
MMPESYEVNEMSFYDMGVSTIIRINYWLWRCNEAQAADNAENWVKAVKVIYKECDTFMKDKEIEDHRQWMENINQQLGRYLDWKNRCLSTKNAKYPPRDLFDALLAWEMLLRRILDRKGLLLKKTDNINRAMV